MTEPRMPWLIAALGACALCACQPATPGAPIAKASPQAQPPLAQGNPPPADASTNISLPAAAPSSVDGGAPDADADVDLSKSGHSIDDLDAWLAAHGAAQGGVGGECAQRGCTCISFVVASVDGDFLLCHFGGIDPVSGGFDTIRIRRVSGGRAPVVLEQDDSLTDDPDYMGTQGIVVGLDVLLHGGRELVLRERPPAYAYPVFPNGKRPSDRKTQSCADALSQMKDPAIYAYRTRVQKMCAGVGRYAWDGQRFARVP
jgi:hypothetical protein